MTLGKGIKCGLLLPLGLLLGQSLAAAEDPRTVDEDLLFGPNAFPPGYTWEMVQTWDWTKAPTDELVAWATWYLDRQDDPDDRYPLTLPFVAGIVMDLGYPSIRQGNEDPELAISLTERIRIQFFDVKEAMIANLKYSPHGFAPDPIQYDHALYKTALLLIASPVRRFFPELDYRTSDELDSFFDADFNVEDIEHELGISPDLQEKRELLRQVVRGFQSLFDVMREAAARVPEVAIMLEETPACALLDHAISLFEGTTAVGEDKEAADLVLGGFPRQTSQDHGHADFQYFIHRHYEVLPIAGGLYSKEFSLSAAAIAGHPEAAFQYAERMLQEAEGVPDDIYLEIATHLSVAERGGIWGARAKLEEVLTLSNEYVARAAEQFGDWRYSRYQEQNCHSTESRP